MIEKNVLGRINHMSTHAIFGGVALATVTQAEADRALEVLLEYGVNHIDTSANYGDSELRIGPWMDQHRQDFFLATKTGERWYQNALDGMQRSLERLRVDQVDLMQLHSMADVVESEAVMGPGGALDALVEARDRGWTRFVGVTAHGLAAPKMLKRHLGRFDFDSVLLPCNYLLMQNPEYAADFGQLMNLCRERNVAVRTMKAIGRDVWGDQPRTAYTWYQPLTDQEAIDKAVHWVMGQPDIFLATAGDINVFPKVLLAVSRFEKVPSDEEMRQLVAAQGMSEIFRLVP